MSEHLRLYVAGRTERSHQAVRAVRRLCSAAGLRRFRLEVVDVLEHPLVAEADGVIATPSLGLRVDGAVRMVVGDLTALDLIDLGLGPPANPSGDRG